MRKRTRNEETQSGKREVEGEGERIAGDCKRVCFHFCSSLPAYLCEGGSGADVFWEAAISDCGSDSEVTDSVLVCVVDLTSSRDLMVDSVSVSVPISQSSFYSSQDPFPASGTLVCRNQEKGKDE